jgi:hypothetical protein
LLAKRQNVRYPSLRETAEIEHLGPGAETYPHQRLRRQQRDMVAGEAIDLHQIARPEILDRGGAFPIPPRFLECSHESRRGCDCQPPGQALSFARPLRVLWRIVFRRGFPETE